MDSSRTDTETKGGTEIDTKKRGTINERIREKRGKFEYIVPLNCKVKYLMYEIVRIKRRNIIGRGRMKGKYGW